MTPFLMESNSLCTSRSMMAIFSMRRTVSRSFGVGEGFLGLNSSTSGFGAPILVTFFFPFFFPLATLGLLVPDPLIDFRGVVEADTNFEGMLRVGLAPSSSSSAAAAFLAAFRLICILKYSTSDIPTLSTVVDELFLWAIPKGNGALCCGF
jgi:hypothetical protein